MDAASIFFSLALTAPLLSLFGSGNVLAAAPSTAITMPWPPFAGNLALSLALAGAAVLCFWLNGQYGGPRAFQKSFARTGTIVGCLIFIHLLITRAEAFAPPSGVTLIGFGVTLIAWGIAGAALVGGRRAVRRALIRDGSWFQPAVIVGPADHAQHIARIIADRPEAGLRVTHILDTSGNAEAPSMGVDGATAMGQATAAPVPIAAGDDIAADLSERFANHAVLISAPSDQNDKATQRLVFLACSVNGRVGIVAGDAEAVSTSTLDDMPLADGTRLLWVQNRLGSLHWRVGKRAFDIVASALMLILLSPLLAMIALPGLLKGQSVMFGHTRVGRYGRRFTCYKFRTMVAESDAILERLLATDSQARREWEASCKLKNDPRITPLGAVLRRTSMDELPQLWNVLRGDMSLVGPRPIIESELSYYGDEAVCYYSVRPGLTGLWQVSGRNDTTYERRVALDISYIRDWSAWKDIVILFKTFFVVLYGTGAY